jgi:hypothetical protein
LAAVTEVHLAVGITAIALNTGAAAYAAWEWYRSSMSRQFWWLQRAGQGVIVLQVVLGGILVITGRKPPGLHVLYGVLPLLVSLIAESLRAASAQLVLDQRGLESAREVGKLAPDDQQRIVAAIIRREMGVMAIASVVVVVLLLRAAQTH